MHFCLFFNPCSIIFDPVFFEMLFNIFLFLFLYSMHLVAIVRTLKLLSVFLSFLVCLIVQSSYNPLRSLLFQTILWVLFIFKTLPNFSEFCDIKNVKVLFLDIQNFINLFEPKFREFFYRHKSGHFEAEFLV